jgi:hypothetical protein
LLGGIGLVVTRTGHLKGEARSLERVPAALGMNRASELIAHPVGDFGASPQAAIGRGVLKQVVQMTLLFPREQARRTTVMLALIGKGFWSLLVVAPSQNPDPAGTIARHLSHFPDALALGEQPDHLQVAAFDGIYCFAIALLQLSEIEMGNDVDIFRHGFPSGRTSLSEGILSGFKSLENSAVSLITHYLEVV